MVPYVAFIQRHLVLWAARIDRFVLALGLTILAATLVPCRGQAAAMFHFLGLAAISALFFLQGARLSRAAVLNGIGHWRLHTLIAGTTFIVFPLLGLVISWLVPGLLPHSLWLGVLFVCVLPSTVQSSIALTSIANGNVAGAVCSATMSNIAGIALTPILFGALASVQSQGNVDPHGIIWVMMELLLPFAAGHALRPWIGAWAERNRKVLAVTDRGSILLVAYTAFSAAVVHGIWTMVPFGMFAVLLLLSVLLLSAALLGVLLAGRAAGLAPEDVTAALFCASQKSLVSGVPIANAMFAPQIVGPILLPVMVYYPLQLIVCGVLAKRISPRQGDLALAEPAPFVPPVAIAEGDAA